MTSVRSLPSRISRVLARSAVATGLSLAATTAFAQTWTQLNPAVSPPPRSAAGMVYDAAIGQTVLFGGFDDNTGNFFGDTWLWDGTTWHTISTFHQPIPRSEIKLAYDSVRQRVVMFSGLSSAGYLPETWEFDGTDWLLQSITGPSGRESYAVAYDSVRQRTVLFGGLDPNSLLADTWEWDGTQWTLQTPANSPSARYGHSMAFDSTRGRVVLFAGHPFCTPGRCFPSNETWEWDGTNWASITTNNAPQARTMQSMVFDTVRNATIMFGGETCGEVIRCTIQGDTWSYDGNDWTMLSPAQSPPPRYRFSMSYDSTTGQTLVFGGWDETTLFSDSWVLNRPVTIGGIVPTSGTASGGDVLHISVAPTASAAQTTVSIGGHAATVTGDFPGGIVVRTPAGTVGAADVSVTNPFGTAVAIGGYTYLDRALAARLGDVNEGAGDREDVLLVNGSAGDATRELSTPVNSSLTVFMSAPSSRTTSVFALYVWVGVPGAGNVVTVPRNVGTMVFPTPFVGTTPQPRVIFNNVGHNALLGTPTFPSSAAPSVVLQRPSGVHSPINATFQGVIQDDASGSATHFSVTNAIILHVTP
jgi:galactose oxidase-like protein